MTDFLHYIFPFAPETKERKLAREILAQLKGGEGSGNFGHAGRPGEVGGSAGEDSGRFENVSGIGVAKEVGKTKDGWKVYEVEKFDQGMWKGTFAVNNRTGKILYTQGGVGHSELLSAVNENVDNYVRFYYRDRLLTAMNTTAASLDLEKGVDNIYNALDELNAKGFPDNTRVNIYIQDPENPYAKPHVVETTIKEYRLKNKKVSY